MKKDDNLYFKIIPFNKYKWYSENEFDIELKKRYNELIQDINEYDYPVICSDGSKFTFDDLKRML